MMDFLDVYLVIDSYSLKRLQFNLSTFINVMSITW